MGERTYVLLKVSLKHVCSAELLFCGREEVFKPYRDTTIAMAEQADLVDIINRTCQRQKKSLRFLFRHWQYE